MPVVFVDTEDRVEETPSAAETNDDEVWLDDGSVTLVAQGIGFRVYKGILAKQSSVLTDLFGKAQEGRTGQEDLVVHLPDSSRDWRHVLRVCMSHNVTLRLRDATPMQTPSAEEVFAYVRLGRKYKIEAIYEQAMEYLKSYFNPDYNHFYQQDIWTPPRFRYVDAIGVVNIARLTSDEPLRLMALLVCCLTDSTELLTGIAYSDGEVETLSPEDLALCWVARPKLSTARLRSILRIVTPLLASPCASRKEGFGCRDAAQCIMGELHTNATFLEPGNPFMGFNGSEIEELLVTLCERCRASTAARHSKQHRAAWNDLPALMGMPCPEWKMVDIDG
ncbi:uncharacterized protein BXZ73DRAFT_89658 [Epithele typhae]|uniref:uncharacterized protein n=1 Tax=Epithele typhae TaxID=378194 RepID=UPI0020085FCF|nr:uncharacterized protein BXZ73DRAFT_89658 [Epithele typhae]KAH9933989.1 hypothetical protein BXZ73DRAFT_89658 [Epithele typhae]